MWVKDEGRGETGMGLRDLLHVVAYRLRAKISARTSPGFSNCARLLEVVQSNHASSRSPLLSANVVVGGTPTIVVTRRVGVCRNSHEDAAAAKEKPKTTTTRLLLRQAYRRLC